MQLLNALLVFLLVCLHDADAINAARGRKYGLMAEMGLLPDGTPMQLPPEIKASLAALPPPPPNETIEEEYVRLPLDNFAENDDFDYQGYFNNRFWVSEAAYKPGGPVFLYDVGEADASGNALFRLQNATSFFKQFVDKYNGIGIVWEHRYYGNSTPEPIDLHTPPEAFEWLTTEQSLADVDRFARQFKRANINYTLTPDTTPWIFVGGSYPAMRAAFMRDKYPKTIFASYASSAPTEAKIDMSVYFEPIWRGMDRYGWGNCTRDVKAALNYIDEVLDEPAAAPKIKELFLGRGAGNNSHATFADALNTPFYQWQSYGVEGGKEKSLRSFCDFISTDPKTNTTSPAEGWAATRGANFTINRWAAYPNFVTMVNDYMETECSKNSTTPANCDLNRPFSDSSLISWTWQYCTQWGFFQSANVGDHQLVSKYNTVSHQKDICHRQFPTAKEPLFPEWPRVDETNDAFGGWNLRPSNTYWSGGEFDPWRTLSPLSAEAGAPHPDAFTDPPECGEDQDENEIFGYVIGDAQHCYDFRTTFAGGEISRTYFTNALDRWLKCFQPQRKYGRRH